MKDPSAPHAILIVDDEPDNLETLRLLLAGEGFEVRVAMSGAEALSVIAEWRPDVLIVDVMMPGMTGLDLCQHLRADPATRNIACIAHSAYPLAQHSNAGIYDRFIPKPAELDHLMRTIRDLLPS